MSRSKVLASVDGDRPLLDNTGPDAIGAFDRLGPHTAEPGSPVFELPRLFFLTAMLDRDAGGVAEQNGVPRLANHLIQPVDVFPRIGDEPFERLAKVFNLMTREDARDRAIDGIDTVFIGRSLPRVRQLLDARRRRIPLRNAIGVVGVP